MQCSFGSSPCDNDEAVCLVDTGVVNWVNADFVTHIVPLVLIPCWRGARQSWSRYADSSSAREKPSENQSQLQMKVARFLLRDGNKVGAEVSPEGLQVFTYEDQKGQVIHALATVKAEREFLRQVPSKLLPLYIRMDQALAKAVGRS